MELNSISPTTRSLVLLIAGVTTTAMTCFLAGYKLAVHRRTRDSGFQKWVQTEAQQISDKSRWKPLEYNVLFGIVGGLGPRALTYFIESVVIERCKIFAAMQCAKTSGERQALVQAISTSQWSMEEVEQVYQQTVGRTQLQDQDHVPLLAAQATTVPPRPKYILKESTVDPTPQLLSVSQGLAAAGATHLAVICNTAHYFWPQVQQSLPHIKCLDVVHLTLGYVARTSVANDIPIGLLATTATLRTRMYQNNAVKAFGLTLISPLELPDGDERQTAVEKVIFGKYGIKSGFDNPDRNLESRQSLQTLLYESLKLQRAFGAKTIILACSELPLILNDDSIVRWLPELGFSHQDMNDIKTLHFVDPGKVLAHEMLRIALLSRSANADKTCRP